jgi:hypothetical protein
MIEPALVIGSLPNTIPLLLRRATHFDELPLATVRPVREAGDASEKSRWADARGQSRAYVAQRSLLYANGLCQEKTAA